MSNYSNVTIKMEVVTPQKAKEWLCNAENFKQECGFNNRCLNRFRVGQLTRDLSNGNWQLSNDAVLLDENECPFNGQHRLQACVNTGISIEIFVARNMPRDSGVITDQGQKRSTTAVLQFAGEKVSNKTGAIARSMAMGLNDSYDRFTSSELVEFFQVHREAIEFIIKNAGTSSQSLRASYRGALARAYYCVEAQVLLRIMGIIDGKIDGTTLQIDENALHLRRFLLQGIGNHSGSRGLEVYAKTEKVVKSTAENKIMHLLRATKKELFPLRDCPVLSRRKFV